MNVVKQDAIDVKIIERCKTCEKQCMQEDLDRSRSCQDEQKQFFKEEKNIDKKAIEHAIQSKIQSTC